MSVWKSFKLTARRLTECECVCVCVSLSICPLWKYTSESPKFEHLSSLNKNIMIEAARVHPKCSNGMFLPSDFSRAHPPPDENHQPHSQCTFSVECFMQTECCRSYFAMIFFLCDVYVFRSWVLSLLPPSQTQSLQAPRLMQRFSISQHGWNWKRVFDANVFLCCG